MTAPFLLLLFILTVFYWRKLKNILVPRPPSLVELDVEEIVDDLIAEHNDFFQRRSHVTCKPNPPIEIHHKDLKEYTQCFARKRIVLEQANVVLQEEGYNMQLRYRGNLVPIKVYKNVTQK